VERGGVQKSGDGLRLVPDVIHTGAASTPEERAKELAPVAAAASYVPFGPEDFRFVDRAAAGKKMIFIGEDPHHDWKIYNTVIGLSLHLRKKLGYGVLAREGCYTGWPYLEARDMGESARLPNVLPEKEFPEDYTAEEPLAAYNRSVPANLRLLCTTLDIDHEIDYAKTNTALYLGFLASRSSSIEARADIAKAIPALPGLKERQELNAYFDDLERRFRAAWSSFLPQDQDEIAFSLSLERASVQWMFRQEVQSKDMDDLRGEYFRKTIERAFAKAKRAGGALICYVGGAHAFLNAFGPGDYTVAKTTEARYFNTQYPASKGRVASILIERIGEWNEPNPGTLEAAAIALMGDKDRVFINLRDRSWTAMKNRPGTFFSAHEPKYDGVLFIK
jgi:hypothetical protein